MGGTGRELLVGRDRELGVLDERLERARSGTGGLVLVTGEPGIGKTRLVSEVATRARRAEMVVSWGRCREDGGAPAYWPWVQALRGLVGGVGPGVSGRELRDVAQLLESVPDDGWASEGDAASRFRLFESISSVIRQASEGRGVVILFDDLHRADEGSLRLLRYLAPELSDAPVLIVAAYRDTDVADDDPLMATVGAVVDGTTNVVMSLGGLDIDAVAAVIAVHCDHALTPEVAVTVTARTSGNPFFVIEVARLLGADVAEAAPGAANAVPPTVRHVIRQRVGRLPVETRRALSAAAVLGRGFGRLPLAEMLGASELAAVAALQPAAAVQIIAPDSDEGGRYRFTHALVQETLYSELALDERTALHRLAADVIASRLVDNDEQLSDLAFHSYHGALGGDTASALDHTLAAGRRARQRLAYEEAARWLSLALEVMDRVGSSEAERLALLLEVADAESRAGHRGTARQLFERAAASAQHLADPAALAEAALGVGATVVTAGTVDWSLVFLLDEAAKESVDEATRARLLSRLAIELYWHDGGTPARRRSAEALQVAESSANETAIGIALHARQFTMRSPAHLQERIAIGERLVKLADAREDLHLACQGATWLAADVLRSADIIRFRALVETLHEIARRSRQPLHRWYATVLAAEQATIEGRVENALELAESAVRLGQQLSVPVAAVYGLGQRAVIARDREGLATMEADIRAAAAQFPYFVTLRALAILAAADDGRTDDADREIDRLAPDGFATIPPDSLWLATIALLTEAAAIAGSTHTAQLAELLQPHRGELVVQGLPNCWGSVDRFLGHAHTALGNWDQADDALLAANADERAIAAPMFTARTTLDRARFAAARGRHDEASVLAAAVIALGERLGLPALAQQARRLTPDATPSRQLAPELAGLSRREREVLAVLSRGSTNKEIASTLVVSVNTVERHLANIYTKLGVRSRTEAAALAVRISLD